MDAQRIYRTFRRHALDLAAMHDVPPEQALLALARAASQRPPNLSHFEIARYVHAQTEHWIVQSKGRKRGFRKPANRDGRSPMNRSRV